MTIKELQNEENDLMLKLSENRNKQRQILTEEWLQKLGISFGDNVEFTQGQKRIRGQFYKIEYSYDGKKPNYPIVKLFNKDGSVGLRESRIWSYDREKIVKI